MSVYALVGIGTMKVFATVDGDFVYLQRWLWLDDADNCRKAMYRSVRSVFVKDMEVDCQSIRCIASSEFLKSVVGISN